MILKMLLPDWRQSTLDNYRIVLTPQSYKDLDDVYAVVLRLSADKETARNYIETIKAAIRKLTTFPKRGTIRTTYRDR